MKFVVIAKTHQVLQQSLLIYRSAGVADLHAAPVRLPRDQTVALEQVADQHLGHRCFVGQHLEQLRRRREARAFHIQPVQAKTIELVNRFPVKQFGRHDPYAYRRSAIGAAPHRLTEVGAQTFLDGIEVDKAAVVEAVEVELERLALDDVVAFAGHREVRQRHLRLATQIEPAELIGRPHVRPQKRRRSHQPELGAFAGARYRKQQRGIVLVNIG